MARQQTITLTGAVVGRSRIIPAVGHSDPITP